MTENETRPDLEAEPLCEVCAAPLLNSFTPVVTDTGARCDTCVAYRPNSEPLVSVREEKAAELKIRAYAYPSLARAA